MHRVPGVPALAGGRASAVAVAAMETGVARKPLKSRQDYERALSARRDPVAGVLARVFEQVRRRPKRVVFAEGEEEAVMRAAVSFVTQDLGTAILVGREDRIHLCEPMEVMGILENPSTSRSREARRRPAWVGG